MSCDEKITGDLEKFNVPEVKFEQNININLTESIIKCAKEDKISVASITEESAKNYGIKYELDHGTTVPLYFINKNIRIIKQYILLLVCYLKFNFIDMEW